LRSAIARTSGPRASTSHALLSSSSLATAGSTSGLHTLRNVSAFQLQRQQQQRRLSSNVTKAPFKKLMAANRGEIATRIMRASSELGIPTVGIFSVRL
jgi:hypothetical protein